MVSPSSAFSAVAVPYYIGVAVPEFRIEGVPLLTPGVAEGQAMDRMTSLFDPLAAWVAEHVPALIQAPDCMAPLGVLAGLQRAGLDPDLVWLDAHGDFNTWETTPSGYLGGMPLAMIVGRGDQTIVRGLGIAPLGEERVVLVDARDLDPGEATALAGSAVRRVTVAELFDLPLSPRPLHIHLDVDIVDPEEMPGLLYPAPGGPGLARVAAALRHLGTAPDIAAISVAHTYDQRAASAVIARRKSAELVEALAPRREAMGPERRASRDE